MAPNFPPWRRRAPKPKLGVEVVTANISQNPMCLHGPTICFERFFIEKKSRKFYACSACRDRKDCPFFMWADQTQSKAYRNTWLRKIKENRPKRSHLEEYKRLSSICEVSPEERGYCTICNMLCLLPCDSDHIPTPLCSAATVITPIPDHLLTHPSQLVPLKENSKCEAQYLFSSRSLKAVVDMVAATGATKVLCVGVPSLHEAIANNETSLSATSMLLDIDTRYRNFFPLTSFVHFNMFNQHFFDGARARQRVITFLTGAKNVCVACDPPFGARVELLNVCFSYLADLWRDANGLPPHAQMSVLLMFPYFLEYQITENLPTFTMLDYQLDYINHDHYTSGSKKAMKRGSAVRVFTNRPASVFPLPESEGYRRCEPCDRWVYASNVHCDLCRGCMGKDGSAYKHCDECGRCVKPSWQHCAACSKCQSRDHRCTGQPSVSFKLHQLRELSSKCIVCGDPGHKRKHCPTREERNKAELERPPKKKRKKAAHAYPISSHEENSQYLQVIKGILSE
ncbi:rRNA N6-adenosine-methyltransferase ZCCHC4 [Hyalella azteca]|uniref:rRNA N6-adenosine-methyltransferase ZCCHC4 n=1 Tax=Hyalella azteca TaxID=294128 RepID=A0A8B7NCY1_HYAAZ|nr:rRNA N6-adenosine-methyltransferase ZCCHC4 [Hyalella azteca]